MDFVIDHIVLLSNRISVITTYGVPGVGVGGTAVSVEISVGGKVDVASFGGITITDSMA